MSEGEEVGVEYCISKFSPHLWFHDDLDGTTYVFFTLVWAQGF